jgi:16S rRNA (adenine1518-N6/adenine1519-N6)-dimethyltransferase
VTPGEPALGRREIRRLLDEAGVTPSRLRGQNFLVDPNTAERIVRLARVGRGDHVVEIGAGLGSLTRSLAASGAEVLAVEIDPRLVSHLASHVPENVRVVLGDAMTADWELLLDASAYPDRRWIAVANLPYIVATPLIIDLLRKVPEIERMVVMVQTEVAERLASGPGSRVYGAASVRVSYFATARILGRVPPDVFYPRPKVESSLLAIDRREPPFTTDEARFDEIDEIVRVGFSSRRKMLRRALDELVTAEMFECAGIDPTARAEQLDVVQWGKLAQCRKTIGRSRAPS